MTDQNKQTEKNKIKACVSDAFFTPWTVRTSPHSCLFCNKSIRCIFLIIIKNYVISLQKESIEG